MNAMKKETTVSKTFLCLILLSMVISTVLLSGCATTQNLYDTIERQKKELNQLKKELEKREKEFEVTQDKLEKELKVQIKSGRIKIEKLKKGLVLTVLDSVLFDSGKAEIKAEGKETLTKIANVLKKDCPDKNVSIEGHTDNEPIKYSGWKSNWELSTTRANNILHFFVDECRLKPERLRVVGFGEHKPVASNETEEGRQQNRRVEIIIFPERITKVEAEL